MLKPKFNAADIEKIFKQKLEAIEAEIIDRLIYIGETFVNNARNNGTYTDRTGNLRNSIGYRVLKNGEIVSEDFSGNAVGRSAGEKIANEVQKKYKKGYVLVVVAGMSYASAVESKNYDVLTASSITAENDLKEAIKEMQKQFNR